VLHDRIREPAVDENDFASVAVSELQIALLMEAMGEQHDDDDAIDFDFEFDRHAQSTLSNGGSHWADP